ncbi:ATP-binding protein [Aeromonas schubertii]|uniref:histidine kinase n=1 Tax=Aeromonas schubertii TaxID=652 RepID=A0ABS7VBC8_9GAMM|nr:ATP-binding protein [Aeromonas schubertii]MBZ6066288.1 two-component sensor histidine kinase [Aeromonas schubertii]
MNQTRHSLRRFLLSAVLLLVSASLTVSALIGYLSASHEMEELFDARLAQSARITEKLLLRYLAQLPDQRAQGAIYEEWEQPHASPSGDHGWGGDDDELTPYGHEFERNLSFQLIADDGEMMLRSPSAPERPLGALEPGFGQHRDGPHIWRTFTLHNAHLGTWLMVAERDDERGELAGKIATVSMLPLIITLPLLLVLLWWLMTRGLMPLTELTREIGERHPANLTPLNIPSPPKEVALLMGELNRLMHTLQETLARERQFTDEAAHELRTPLAVLRLYSENALAAGDEQSRRHSLGKMVTALDRCDRLLRQLLTQARLDNRQQIEASPMRLDECVREAIANLAPLALQKDLQLSLEVADPITLEGQETLLEILFANLIDNALRYTPCGGTIEVRVEREGNRGVVHIADNGPGVPASLLPRLSERFFRVNPQAGNGVGLGLAIVRRIAHLHDADISVHNRPEGGLQVSIYFGHLLDKDAISPQQMNCD